LEFASLSHYPAWKTFCNISSSAIDVAGGDHSFIKN